MASKTTLVEDNKSTTTSVSIVKDSTLFDLEMRGNQDAIQLEGIFPEEVWLLILVDKVKTVSPNETDTLANFSLASLYFRNLLAEKRKFFLFPKVFESLTTWLENTETNFSSTGNDSSSDDSDDSLSSEDLDGSSNSDDSWSTYSEGSDNKAENPSPESGLKISDVLKCREVCHAWNSAFESFYQNSCRYTQMDYDQADNKKPRILGVIEMSMSDKRKHRHPRSFLNHIKRTHGGCDDLSSRDNPFPARSINFKWVTVSEVDSMSRKDEKFREGMSKMLEDYGDNLWHCSMKLEDMNCYDRIEFYWQFKKWLTVMPNLKTFKLNCLHMFTRREMSRSCELLDKMKSDIDLNPLPEMKYLQFLKVEGLAPVIFNELIRQSGHGLTQLEITREQEDDNAIDYDIYSEACPLVQLKELSMNFCSVKHFERMESSEIADKWELEKLYFLYDIDADFLKWSRVFQMIEKNWSKSIVNLALEMPAAKSKEEEDSVLEASLSTTILQLPYLKRVYLNMRQPCGLDFLLPSKNILECIEIFAEYNVDKEKNKPFYQLIEKRQTVKFLGFENHKEKFTSNILELFPKLNYLKIVTLLNHSGDNSRRICVYKAGKIISEDKLG